MMLSVRMSSAGTIGGASRRSRTTGRFRATWWRLVAVGLALTGIFGGVLGPQAAFARTAATEIVHSSVALWITGCEAEADPRDDDPDVIEELAEDGCGLWGSGSGTIIDPSGLILTNAHVVTAGGDDPLWLQVGVTDDPRDFPTFPYFARPIAIDPTRDLAVVQVAYDARGREVDPDDLDLPALTLADDTRDLALEDPVRLIGYPGVGGVTVTVIEAGVSGFHFDEDNQDLGNEGWIKVSPAAGSGVSGGTAVNEDGELIGVPTATFGTDLRCDDQDGDGAYDTPTECRATSGEAQLVRPIEVVHEFLDTYGVEIDPRSGRGDDEDDEDERGDRDDDRNDDDDEDRENDRDEDDRDEDDREDEDRDDDREDEDDDQESPETVEVTFEATVVDAATGEALDEPTLLIMQPGLTFADLDQDLIDDGDFSQFAAIEGGNARGRIEFAFDAVPGEEYTLIAVADGYVGLYQDGVVLVEDGEDDPTTFDWGEIPLEAE